MADMFSLAKLSQATQLLAECNTVSEAKQYFDLAEAARHFATVTGMGREAQNHATEIKLRAERRIGELLRSSEKAIGARGKIQAHLTGGNGGTTACDAPTLADLGISKIQSSRSQAIAAIPEPAFEQHIVETIAASELTTNGMMRLAQEYRRQAKREAMAAPGAFPEGIYRVWYADPPWQYNDSSVIGGDWDNYGRAERHYPTISTPELCAKGQEWSDQMAEDAVLFLWATVPLLPDGLAVMAAWSFTYKTHFVWDKQNHNFGNYSSVQHETLLLGTRGSCLPDIDEKIRSIQAFPRGEHSAKPEEFRRLIDTLYPYGPRIELFARGELPDPWQGWGNQAEQP